MIINKELLDFEPGTKEFEEKEKELEESAHELYMIDDSSYWERMASDCFDSHEIESGLPMYIGEEMRYEDHMYGMWSKDGQDLESAIKEQLAKIEKHLLEDDDVTYITSHIDGEWLYDTFEDTDFVYEAKKHIEPMNELQEEYCESNRSYYDMLEEDDHREYTHHNYDDIKKTDKKYLRLIKHYCFKTSWF